MTLTQANGLPMAGAGLSVYYFPSVISAGTQLQLMGSATSDSAGTVAFALDTSMVPAGDLGDNGDGVDDAFNAVVIGTDSAGDLIIHHEVITEGGVTTDSASALTDGSGQPVLATPISQVTDPQMAPTAPDGVIGTDYRYVPVLAMNSGDGMSSQLNYTYSTSTGRQTNIETAIQYAGTTEWSDSGGMLEETDRTINAPWYYKGSIHRYIWASYLWDEYHFEGCINKYDCYDYDEWDPDHFTGYTTDDNPNYFRDGSRIGEYNYTVPSFTYCQGEGSCWFALTTYNSGWGRSSGTRQTYSFELDVAGFLNLSDWATYASITSQNWWYQSSGCGSPNERILWGNSVDPGVARIVQADCIDPYTAQPGGERS